MDDVRLIDANALVKEIESVHCKGCNNYNGAMCRACEWMDAMDYIEDAPTIDAQPVKHGKWVMHKAPFPIQSIYSCSECNSSVPGNIFVVGCDFEFCPYCGAKMDGGVEGAKH